MNLSLLELKKQEEVLVESFNRSFDIGEEVTFYEFIDENGDLFGDTLETTTRSEAYMMCDSACILLEDKSGCVALSNIVMGHREI